MAGRLIENEADAKRCLDQVERCGGDIGSWARAHGVDGRSLNAWKNNMARRSEPEPERGEATLVELVPAVRSSASARYVLDLGDARLEFDDTCSVETIRRVLEALRTC